MSWYLWLNQLPKQLFSQYTGSQESVLELEEDEFFMPRPSLTEHDIVLVQNQRQRRHSSVRIAMTRPREDRATSPCSLSSLNPDTALEPAFVSAAVDMSDVAVNTSDPPSEADYESSEERWTSPFPKKVARQTRSDSQESVTYDACVLNAEEENYDVCDLTFEDDWMIDFGMGLVVGGKMNVINGLFYYGMRCVLESFVVDREEFI